MKEQLYKLEIFLPEDHKEAIFRALWSVDAGHIGKYDRCLSWSRVNSCWRPLKGSQPFYGRTDNFTWAEEIKIEVCCREGKLEETIAAVKRAHPYEEPVINVLNLVRTGL